MVRPSFFLRVADRKPRTEWACQPLAAISSAKLLNQRQDGCGLGSDPHARYRRADRTGGRIGATTALRGLPLARRMLGTGRLRMSVIRLDADGGQTCRRKNQGQLLAVVIAA